MSVNGLDSNMSTLCIEPLLICGSEDPQLKRAALAPLLVSATGRQFQTAGALWHKALQPKYGPEQFTQSTDIAV